MSTSDQVRAILGGTIQAYRADPAYGEGVAKRVGVNIADLQLSQAAE